MSDPVYFLSDVHLGAGPPPVEVPKRRDLVAWLDRVEGGATLYLLGDVFDFWFDDGGPPPASYVPVLEALRRCTERGVRGAFMGGNHDHWVRGRRGPGTFERATGFAVLDDPHRAAHHGLRLLLTHGDALGGAPGVYGIVRAVLRNRLAIAAFRRLPRRVAALLADRTSAASRARHDDARTARHRATLVDAARRILAEEDVDAVVAGHVHVPERLDLPGGTYLNLGDWVEHRTYGRLADGALSLETAGPAGG